MGISGHSSCGLPSNTTFNDDDVDDIGLDNDGTMAKESILFTKKLPPINNNTQLLDDSFTIFLLSFSSLNTVLFKYFRVSRKRARNDANYMTNYIDDSHYFFLKNTTSIWYRPVVL